MALGPVNVFTQSNVKLRWTDSYTSDAINKSFIGMPKGIYLGFTPVISGLTLTLRPDIAIVYSGLTGAFALDTVVTGGVSGATATIRVIRAPNPARGILQLTGLTGVFESGETIAAPGAVATLDQFTTEGLSMARVATTSTLAGGRTEDAITVVTGEDIDLDFSPGSVIDSLYYVMVTASYELGQESTGQVISRLSPADGRFEASICIITKSGGGLILDPLTPEARHTPYADGATRVGFADPGSIQDLSAALQTVQEVIAARTGSDGVVSPGFLIPQAQETGLPGRLNTDLRNDRMPERLGKSLLIIPGNDYALPTGSTLNASGSFSAKIRDRQPYRDITNNILPPGVTVPVLLQPDGSDSIELTVTGATGTFTPGEDLFGVTSGATGVIRAQSAGIVEVNELKGSFFVGEAVSSIGPPTASATISAIDQREGVITAPETGTGGDPERNVVFILDTLTGKKPTNTTGDAIYGRLLFGPSGTSGGGGGDPGELLVAENAGEQINWTNGSTAITGNNIDFTEYLLPGDIIEGDDGRFYEVSPAAGAVQTGTVLLTTGKPYVGPNASSGLAVGAGPRRRLRYIVKLVAKDGLTGVEVDQTLPTGSVPAGAQLRLFFPSWLNRAQSRYSATLDLQAAGDSHALQDPGSSVPGIAYGAAIGPTAQVTGAIKSWKAAGADPGVGNYHTINYNTGEPSLSLAQAGPGVININAAGPPGPPGAPGGGGGGGPTGDQGLGFEDFQNLNTISIDVIGGGTGTDTFDVSPNVIRFYMIDAAMDVATGNPDEGYITAINPTPTANPYTDSVLTFEYKLDDGGSFQGVKMIVYCAIATD